MFNQWGSGTLRGLKPDARDVIAMCPALPLQLANPSDYIDSFSLSTDLVANLYSV